MAHTKEETVNWLKYSYKGYISDLGADVAWFLDRMWGLHNINRTSLRKVDWSNDTWIEVICDKPLATVDNSDLTRIVVISHIMMLRVELKGVYYGYVALVFHKRESRDKRDGFYKWCPDIHEHVQSIAKHYEEAR